MSKDRVIRLLIAIAVLAPLVWLGRKYYDDLRELRSVRPVFLLAILALYVFMRVFNGLITKIALRALGHVVSLYEGFMLAVLTTYANLVIPRAGLGVPALYLKSRRGVSYADFTSQALVVTAFQMGAIGALGLLAQAVLTSAQGVRFDPLVGVVFLAAMVGGLGTPMIRPVLFREHPGRIASFVRRVSEAWGRISAHRATVLAMIAWNVPLLTLRAFRLQVCFWAVGASHVSFTAALVASLLSDLMFFVSVTPAGLGFREAAITYSSAMLGTTPEQAFNASVLDRVIWTLGVVVIAQFGMWQMIRPAIRDLKAKAVTTTTTADPPAVV
jgi:uncharacterized membrane protein YbhN (UPF0104 family)